MKKILSFYAFAFIILFSYFQSSAQSGVLQIYSGYGQTAYNMKGYNAAGYMPLGLRAAIGSGGIQIGADCWTSVVDPKFNITDTCHNQCWKEKTSDTYLGAMLRAQMSDDPRDFAVILRAGVGMYISKKDIDYSDYYLSQYPTLSSGKYKYDNSVGYSLGVGCTFPLIENKRSPFNLQFTLDGQFNYNPRKCDGVMNYFTSWGIQAGLCYNLFNNHSIGHY